MPEVRLVKTKGTNMEQENLVIKVRKLTPEAELPKQATGTDAGYDLVALDNGEIKWAESEAGGQTRVIQYIQYRTGLTIEPPLGYHTEIFPRSSITKYDLMLANSIGLVDEGYRGEILVRFKYTPPLHDINIVRGMPIKKYQKGDRIAQLVIRKTLRADFVEVEQLLNSERGTGGWGSTG